jgi:Holliday junction resolvase RusA-like endonuclease
VVDIQKIKDEIYHLYDQETEVILDRENMSDKEAGDFVRWFNKKCLENLDLFELKIERVEVKVPRLSTDIADKVGMLSQYHCPICRDSGFPFVIIPIRISPESKQAMSGVKKKRAAFELAIREYIHKSNDKFSINDRFCLHVVFVLGCNSRDKDLDNMAKALLDALKGSLFEDDSNIDHLSLLKIRHNYEDDNIYVNIRRSNINSTDDLLAPYTHGVWGRDKIDLDDYLSKV